MDDKRSRPLLIIVAAIFLFESWVWQGCVALGRRFIAVIPWAAMKGHIAAFIALLPAPAALAIFLIPVAIVEPLKILCFALIAHNHIFLGVLGFIALKYRIWPYRGILRPYPRETADDALVRLGLRQVRHLPRLRP